jgi:septal ring factor EnvC (AmiA/AmiB activator)
VREAIEYFSIKIKRQIGIKTHMESDAKKEIAALRRSLRETEDRLQSVRWTCETLRVEIDEEKRSRWRVEDRLHTQNGKIAEIERILSTPYGPSRDPAAAVKILAAIEKICGQTQ